MLFMLILAIPLIFILFMEITNLKKKHMVNKIPGPSTLPLIGNAHQVGKTPSEILNKLFEWWRVYGHENFRIWIGYFPNISIVTAKDMEFVLSSSTLIDKSDVYSLLHPWLGTGLLTGTGMKWHKHRKMITPSFHFKILQDFHEVMNVNSNKFIEKLHTASAGDTIFDFQECTHYLTLDVICDTAMGVHINAMDQHDSEIVKSFKEMCYNINMRAFHPIQRKNEFYKFSPGYGAYKKTLKVLQDFTYDVIKQRIEARKEATTSDAAEEVDEATASQNGADLYTKKRMAFLDTLLTSTIDGKPLTLDEIYEEVSTFMFEGHDTTTSGIAFTVFLLSRHPRIQRKVYAEQKAIMGANLKRNATFQEISEMKYLESVIKESQRLYPSVPLIGRQTDKDYNINGMHVPKGTTLNLFIMALGYNEKVFKDPYICRPERFETEKPGPFEYVPFSAGPRNCIGQKFAMLELKTVISKVVREFEILPALDELISQDGSVTNFIGLSKEEQMRRRPNPHKYDPILSAVLTLKSENGLHLRLRERKDTFFL